MDLRGYWRKPYDVKNAWNRCLSFPMSLLCLVLDNVLESRERIRTDNPTLSLIHTAHDQYVLSLLLHILCFFSFNSTYWDFFLYVNVFRASSERCWLVTCTRRQELTCKVKVNRIVKTKRFWIGWCSVVCLDFLLPLHPLLDRACNLGKPVNRRRCLEG